MNMPVMVFLCAGEPAQPIQILIDQQDPGFTPLECLLLSQLAHTDGSPVRRDILLDSLVLKEPRSLYRLVYKVRQKLKGFRGQLKHVGSCTTRRGVTFGFSGYQLVGFLFRWHNVGF